MSPTELDLQAALHDGEDGPGPNVNSIIANAQAVRARRRRTASAAAAVVIVAGGGVGIVLSADRNDESASSANGGPTAALARSTGANVPGGNGGKGSVPLPQVGGALEQACPAAVHPAARGGRTAGDLVPAPVRTVVVCSYGSPRTSVRGVVPGRLVLAGADAAAVVASFERAGAVSTETPCPAGEPTRSRVLAFVAVTAEGRSLAPVTTTLTTSACHLTISNGRVVRYDWRPPARLTGELIALTPTALPRAVPSGRVAGSPVRS